MNYWSNLKSNYSSGNLAVPNAVTANPNLSAKVKGATGLVPNLSSSSLSSLAPSYVGAPTPATLGYKLSPSDPFLVCGRLIKWLETKGLKDEYINDMFDPSVGVSSVHQKDIEKLKIAIAKDGESVQLVSFEPLVIAEVLKYFLLSVEPLSTYEMYDAFMITHTILNYQDKVKYLRSILIVLPKYSQILLQKLLNLIEVLVHLRGSSTSSKRASANPLDIDSLANSNKTPTLRLAEIFGPIFFRPREITYYMDNDEKIGVEVTKILIQEHPVLMKIIETSAENPTSFHPGNSLQI